MQKLLESVERRQQSKTPPSQLKKNTKGLHTKSYAGNESRICPSKKGGDSHNQMCGINFVQTTASNAEGGRRRRDKRARIRRERRAMGYIMAGVVCKVLLETLQ